MVLGNAERSNDRHEFALQKQRIDERPYTT